MARQYATATFDAGKETEQSFRFEALNESVTNNSLTMNAHYSLDDDIPDLAPLKDYAFSTLTIKDADGKAVPVFGTYTSVTDCSLNYFSSDDIYTVNLVIT